MNGWRSAAPVDRSIILGVPGFCLWNREWGSESGHGFRLPSPNFDPESRVSQPVAVAAGPGCNETTAGLRPAAVASLPRRRNPFGKPAELSPE